MTDGQKDEIVALAFEYMRTHKMKDRNAQSISRQRILLFLALEQAEAAPSEPRRDPEESTVARPSDDGSPSNSVSG